MGDRTDLARVEALFHSARSLPADRRGSFLRRECRGDIALERQVTRLLARDAVTDPRIDAPVADAGLRLLGVEDRELIGSRVGPYEIGEPLGRGGMGTVYRARRQDGHFQQDVAIKIIRRGMDTDFILQRFRQERQILAGLDHPGIARLLDGGATESGRPYLVMECVYGEPIDSYCRTRGLSIEACLELFFRVGAAVQFAHGRLVVHRDLKPSNILVTADGQPRLLDFGTAKLLDADPGITGWAPTSEALRMFTPGYASPEQIRGETITTATDVFSLGVLLFELLSEAHPFKAPGRSNAKVIQRTTGPGPYPLPSRAATERGRGRRLTGDLDAIVAKAMRQEPEERYPSVEQLVADLERYRGSRPVSARCDSQRYWAHRFGRRSRWTVSAAMLAVIAVSTFTWALKRESR